MSISIPPWTPEQVDAMNAHQRDPACHPYTCGSGNRTDAVHLDGEGVLVAGPWGWKCPFCDYEQFWVAESMVNPVEEKS